MHLMKILLLCFVTFLMQGHGFSEDTLVYGAEHQLVPINCIAKSTQVRSYRPSSDTWMSGTMHDQTSCECTVVVKITVGEHTIIAAPEQLFLCVINGVLLWKQAADVSPADQLQSMHGPKRVASAHAISLDQPIRMHSITVFPTHTFCITEEGIVVHNIFLESGAACVNGMPLFLESASLFSGGIAITPAGVIFLGGVAVAGVTYGLVRLARYWFKKEPAVVQVSECTVSVAPAHPGLIYNEQADNNQPSSPVPSDPLPQIPGSPPDPDDEKFWESYRNAIKDNKLEHIFENLEHQLNRLVNILGTPQAVVHEVVKKLLASGKLPTTGVFKQIAIEVAGSTVFVNGTVINGIPQIGTFYIPWGK